MHPSFVSGRLLAVVLQPSIKSFSPHVNGQGYLAHYNSHVIPEPVTGPSCEPLSDGPILYLTSSLDVLGVDSRRPLLHHSVDVRLLAAFEVDEFEVECVHMPRKESVRASVQTTYGDSTRSGAQSQRHVCWHLPKDCQADVDEQIGAASSNHEHTEGRYWEPRRVSAAQTPGVRSTKVEGERYTHERL